MHVMHRSCCQIQSDIHVPPPQSDPIAGVLAWTSATRAPHQIYGSSYPSPFYSAATMYAFTRLGVADVLAAGPREGMLVEDIAAQVRCRADSISNYTDLGSRSSNQKIQ